MYIPISSTINFAATGVEAKLQSASFLLSTVIGSCPMDRGFGWEPPVDDPNEYAKTAYAAEVVELIEQNISGMTVEEVTFEKTGDNLAKLVPRVKVVIENG